MSTKLTIGTALGLAVAGSATLGGAFNNASAASSLPASCTSVLSSIDGSTAKYYRGININNEYNADGTVVGSYIGSKLYNNSSCRSALGLSSNMIDIRAAAVTGQTDKYSFTVDIYPSGGGNPLFSYNGTISLNLAVDNEASDYYDQFISKWNAIKYTYYGVDAVNHSFDGYSPQKYNASVKGLSNLSQYNDVLKSYSRASIQPLYVNGGMGATATPYHVVTSYNSVFIGDVYCSTISRNATYQHVMVAPTSTSNIMNFVKGKVSLPSGYTFKGIHVATGGEIIPDNMLNNSYIAKEPLSLIKADIDPSATMKSEQYIYEYTTSDGYDGAVYIRVATVSDDAYAKYTGAADIDTTDEKTGVSISGDATNITFDTDVKITDVSATANAKGSVKSGEQLVAAYDFTLYAISTGKKISNLGGNLTVRVPIPAAFADSKLVARYVASNGSTPEKDISVRIVEENGQYYAIFKVKHFSSYALIRSNGSSATSSANSNGSSNKKADTPATGTLSFDKESSEVKTSYLGTIIATILASIAAGIVVIRRKIARK